MIIGPQISFYSDLQFNSHIWIDISLESIEEEINIQYHKRRDSRMQKDQLIEINQIRTQLSTNNEKDSNEYIVKRMQLILSSYSSSRNQ